MADTANARSTWWVVLGLGITQIISWGSIYYAFSLLIDPLAIAVAVDKPTIVGAFSIALLVAGLASAPVGSAVDRHGGRWVMAAGSVLGAACLVALAHVQSVAQLYSVFVGLGLAMAATLYDPAFAVLGQVFREGQRKAITALTLFGGFASTVFWPLTQWLIEGRGWQGALMVLGLLNLVVCAPVHLLMLSGRTLSAEATGGKRPVDRTALQSVLRDSRFYWLCLAFTGNALVFSAMSVHLISLLQDKGLTLAQAAWIGALIGPMQVLGRIMEYVFLSKIHPARVGMLAMWLLPVALALLAVLGGQMAGLAAFALLYGASNGVMTIVRGAIPAELYGRENYGTVNGAMATPVLVAKAAGPIAASLVIAVSTGGSGLVWLLAAVAAASAGLFTLTLRTRSPERADVIVRGRS
ncbi:MFS transporter [Piscinibacter sp. HJYY11]|uniref:MFS transporter n=1 Tax=Piscinibacter sp. HJYY11 TaxID=2801333 RepID=UPI002873F395|nr:MFS transporter [Piscinibacter sp. HJYY11]